MADTVIQETKTIQIPGMVTVKAGEMLLGNTKHLKESYYTVYPGYYDWPVLPIRFTYDFELGETPVTFGQFKVYADSKEGRSLGIRKLETSIWAQENLPITRIPYWLIAKYLNWLSTQSGLPVAFSEQLNPLDANGEVTEDITQVLGYRLPTTAEWEYAARGGHLGDDGYTYPGSNNIHEVAWFERNSGDAPYISPELRHKLGGNIHTLYTMNVHEVGRKKPNKLDLYDMAGNVWEWSMDLWSHQNPCFLGGVNPSFMVYKNSGGWSKRGWNNLGENDEYNYPRVKCGGSYREPEMACVIPCREPEYIHPQGEAPKDVGVRIARTRR